VDGDPCPRILDPLKKLETYGCKAPSGKGYVIGCTSKKESKENLYTSTAQDKTQ